MALLPQYLQLLMGYDSLQSGLAMTPRGVGALIGLSCNTLSNAQMTNASGLQNLVKNIGGAIGTSVAATMLSRFAQVHQHNLVEHLSPLNNIFIEKINILTANFSQYTDVVTANYMAHTMLYKQLLQQSSLKSFVSVFTVFAIASFVIIPLLLFLTNKKTTQN